MASIQSQRQTGSKSMSIWKMLVACSVAGALVGGQLESAAAAPMPTHVTTMKAMTSSDTTQVHWRGGGWGWGVGALAAGAIIGGAIASAPYGYYGGPYAAPYGYGYGYGYAPAYYGYAPAYPRYYGYGYRPYRPYYGYRYGYYRPYRAYYRRGYW
jgi:hypothetical protein